MEQGTVGGVLRETFLKGKSPGLIFYEKHVFLKDPGGDTAAKVNERNVIVVVLFLVVRITRRRKSVPSPAI